MNFQLPLGWRPGITWLDDLRARATNGTIVLTEQQEALRFQLATIEGQVHTLRQKHNALLVGHKCIAGPREPFDSEDKWFSTGGTCVICGKNHGWWCPKSDDGICEYDSPNDPAHDFCLHCGHPEERK